MIIKKPLVIAHQGGEHLASSSTLVAFRNAKELGRCDGVIPTEDSRINLKDQKLIRGARKKGLEIHYWTINDPKTILILVQAESLPTVPIY